MNSDSKIPEDLLALIHQAMDHELADSDVALLEKGLKGNRYAKELFIKLSRLNARLVIQHQVDEAFRPVHEQLQSVTASVSRSASSDEENVTLPISPARSSRSGLSSPLLRYAAVVGLAVGTTLFLSKGSNEQSTSESANLLAADLVAANVFATHGAEWQTSENPETPQTRSLKVGEMVRLQEGLLQLDFMLGSTCLLEGPAVFEVASASGGTLYDGRLVTTADYIQSRTVLSTRLAQVRAKSAKIAVSADRSGKSVIYVLEGKAQVQVGQEQANQAIIQLAKGDRLFFDEDGSFAENSSAQEPAFVDRLPMQAPAFNSDVIWLGNLFDDSTTASLEEAMKTDTYQAAAETIDLGVATVIDGGLDVNVELASDGVTFNFSNYGGFGNKSTGLPSNDTYRSNYSFPIRTTGKQYNLEAFSGKKVEEGIGLHANELLTFDLDEIRAAGSLEGRAMRFAVDRAGINDDIDFSEKRLPSSVRVIAIVSTQTDVLVGYVNGIRVDVQKRSNVYSFKPWRDAAIKPIVGKRYVKFDVPVPEHAKYLTLAALSCDGNDLSASGDHSVFSGARLEVLPAAPSNGVASLTRLRSGLLSIVPNPILTAN